LLRNGRKEYLSNEVQWEKPDTWSKGLGSYSTSKKVYANELFYRETLSMLKTKDKRPFFIYLNFTIPHNNGEAPKAERFESPSIKAFASENWSDADKNYAASLHAMDAYVGGILDFLRKKGLKRNTLVFFTSDNGATEDIPERFSAHFTLRGKKRSPYEGGLRTPMLIWGQDLKPSLNDYPLAHWDFLPTACELAGVAPPERLDGRSFAPLLRGETMQGERALYWEFHERGPWRALRQGDWKLIEWLDQDKYELFNLGQDPAEKQNLSEQEKNRAQLMQQVMDNAPTPSSVFRFGKK
jgi:arylsulfatase A